MIKKIKGKYVVVSESSGRSFGTYRTLKEAKKRLRQIEFFKRIRRGPALQKAASPSRTWLRKKSLTH